MSRKPSYTECGVFRMPMGFPSKALLSALQYRAEPSDIFVSAYPKCGMTWVQNIVYLILGDAIPLAAEQRMTELFPHLEEVGKDSINALPAPRLIKTHLPFVMTPYHPKTRYIYVARNPFDCAVSFFHHTRGFPKHYDFADGTFEDFFECFVAGEVDFGDYFDNLTSWYAHKDDQNVLFLTYESIKLDLCGAVLSIGKFLGHDFSQNESLVEMVLHHSSFSSMSENQDRWSSPRPENMPAFIRKGVVGDWVNQFSPEQTRCLLEKCSRREQGCNLEALWPDIFAMARQHC